MPRGVTLGPRFRDGLGVRVVEVDKTSGDTVEVLQLCPELCAFEKSIKERTARLSNFRHPRFAPVRSVESVSSPDSRLGVVSDHIVGPRLSEILEAARTRRLVVDTNAALHLIRELLSAVSVLHESRNVTDGAIAPERLIITPRGRLVIVDYTLGLALERLQYNRTRLWRDFRIAMPPTAGAARFDRRADVVQIGTLAMALLLGRPLDTTDYSKHLKFLFIEAGETTVHGDRKPLSAGLRTWLERTLPLEARKPFATAQQANVALEQILTKERRLSVAPAALKAFVGRYLAHADENATAAEETPADEPAAERPMVLTAEISIPVESLPSGDVPGAAPPLSPQYVVANVDLPGNFDEQVPACFVTTEEGGSAALEGFVSATEEPAALEAAAPEHLAVASTAPVPQDLPAIPAPLDVPVALTVDLGPVEIPVVDVFFEPAPRVEQIVPAEIAQEIIPEIIPETAPEIIPETAPEIASEIVPEIVSAIAPEIIPEIIPETAPEIVPEIAPVIVSAIVPVLVSETAPEIVSAIAPEIAPEVVSEIAPEIVPEIAPVIVSAIVPVLVSETAPEIVSEMVPEIVSEIAPEVVSEIAPLIVSEMAPETISETALEIISEIVPETISEIVPETISEIGHEIAAETVSEVGLEIAASAVESWAPVAEPVPPPTEDPGVTSFAADSIQILALEDEPGAAPELRQPQIPEAEIFLVPEIPGPEVGAASLPTEDWAGWRSKPAGERFERQDEASRRPRREPVEEAASEEEVWVIDASDLSLDAALLNGLHLAPDANLGLPVPVRTSAAAEIEAAPTLESTAPAPGQLQVPPATSLALEVVSLTLLPELEATLPAAQELPVFLAEPGTDAVASQGLDVGTPRADEERVPSAAVCEEVAAQVPASVIEPATPASEDSGIQEAVEVFERLLDSLQETRATPSVEAQRPVVADAEVIRVELPPPVPEPISGARTEEAPPVRAEAEGAPAAAEALELPGAEARGAAEEALELPEAGIEIADLALPPASAVPVDILSWLAATGAPVESSAAADATESTGRIEAPGSVPAPSEGSTAAREEMASAPLPPEEPASAELEPSAPVHQPPSVESTPLADRSSRRRRRQKRARGARQPAGPAPLIESHRPQSETTSIESDASEAVPPIAPPAAIVPPATPAVFTPTREPAREPASGRVLTFYVREKAARLARAVPTRLIELGRTPVRWRQTVAAALILVALGGVRMATAYWFKTPPPTGGLIVETVPDGLDILIDSTLRGRTPMSLTLLAGDHALEVRGKGLTRTLPVRIAPGVQAVERLSWPVSARTGTVEVKSVPPGATVSIDGQSRGVTPLTVKDLPARVHTLVVQGRGGRVEQAVAIEPEQTTRVSVPVFPGWLAVFSPFDLQVLENGRLLGTTDVDRIMLPAGRHVIELVNEEMGYRVTRPVNIRPGDLTPISVELPNGTLQIDAPLGFEVWLDGERVGETPLAALEVSLGTHEVRLRHPEAGERRYVVVVTQRGPARVTVEGR